LRRRIAKNEELITVKNGIPINAVCEYCEGPAGWDTFRSAENMLEFNLSGYCQSCQDAVPGGGGKNKVPKSVFFRSKTKKASGFKSSGGCK